MDRETSRPRMRSGVHARGVRVRGGAVGVAAQVPAVAVDTNRGRACRRGRRRGGRQVRPGPSTIDDETCRPRMRSGVHARGIRVRGGAVGVAPQVPAVAVDTNRGRACRRGRRRGGRQVRPGPSTIDEPNPGPSQLPETSQCPGSPFSSVPSAAIFVECETKRNSVSSTKGPSETETISTPSTSSSSMGPSCRRECLREEDILYYLKNGSDESDDEDEEEFGVPILPRVSLSMCETPLDMDEEADMENFEPAVVKTDNTEQPWSLYQFDWKNFPHSPISAASRREKFSVENAGPTVTTSDPYEIFTNIWDRPIMEHIAAQTNKYAQEVASQTLQNHNLHPNSRISRWYNTTVDELYVFFGVILAMGIETKTRLEEYWDATPANIFFGSPEFSAYMSIDRFILLCKCLHFNHNDNMCALNLNYSEARLFKIQPILSHLNEKFQKLYIPEQNLSLVNNLLMWKTRIDISQLIPNKTAQRGIKTYELCESKTGYLWRFEIHAHKKFPVQSVEDPLEAFTPSIVLQLVKGLEYKGYTLWMENFYQSPCLARRLKCLGFDCAGTLRTDREFVPQALHALTKEDMRRGQITGLTSGDVDIVVWKDAYRISMISTYHGISRKTVRRSTAPTIIMDYIIMMVAVDKTDQFLQDMYFVERKQTKVWYKKLFRRLLNISFLNSFIIYKKNSDTPVCYRKFRLNLIESIFNNHITPLPILPQAEQNKVDVSHRLG